MEFAGEHVEAAFRAVLYDVVDDDLAAPDGLATSIAVELATHLAPSAVMDGATSALFGVLMGVHLSEPGDRLPDSLAAAVDVVRVLGRTRVIASHCDLEAVARVERDVAALFGPGHAPIQLFEIGLAIGLASSYA
jgi:hypothetical protein